MRVTKKFLITQFDCKYTYLYDIFDKKEPQSNTYDSNDMGSINSVVVGKVNCALIVLENNCWIEIR